MIGEDEHYEKYTKEQMEKYSRNTYSMKVYPINFATKHKEMLGHAKLMLERGYISINPTFHKLVTSLSTAVDNEGSLDKQVHHIQIYLMHSDYPCRIITSGRRYNILHTHTLLF
jgi:hypothetical protein